MSLLGIGFVPEDFTGWDDTSAPVYTGINGTTIWKTTWGRPAISLTTSTADPISKCFGCLKLQFSEKSNSFSTQSNRYFGSRSAFTGGVNPAGARVVSVWHAANGCKIVLAPNGTANTYDFYLTPDFYTWSKWTPLGIPFAVNAGWLNFTVDIRGAGTSSGKLTVTYGDGSDGFIGTTTTNTWTGDLTDYSEFSAFSNHDAFSSAEGAWVINMVAATESLVGAYVGCYIPQTTGTLSEWYNSGYTTSASTIPASSVNTYANALYGTAAGQREVFTASTAFQYAGTTNNSANLKPAYVVRYVVANAAASVVDPTTASTIQPIFYDPTTADVHSFGDATTPSATITQMQWVSEKDPTTGILWNPTDLLRYQFGFERVA